MGDNDVVIFEMPEEMLDEEKKKIAAELKERLDHLEWSYEDLAIRVGMQPKTIERIMEAKIWMNLKQYLLILSAMEMERLEPVWK